MARCPVCLERIPEDVDGIDVNIRVLSHAHKDVDIEICATCWNHLIEYMTTLFEPEHEKSLSKLKV